MRVRAAVPGDLQRLVTLVRTVATGAQWSEAQLATLLTSEVPKRVILVLTIAESEEQETTAAAHEQIPVDRLGAGTHFVRSENHRVVESAEETERVEGFVVGQMIPPECELENIVVSPEWQRRGYGKTLLRGFLECARRSGCEAVFLEVRESNRVARGLYEKCGFREAGRRVKYYVQPQEDAVIYRLKLPDSASGTVQNQDHGTE